MIGYCPNNIDVGNVTLLNELSQLFGFTTTTTAPRTMPTVSTTVNLHRPVFPELESVRIATKQDLLSSVIWTATDQTSTSHF
ncbi:hypothetical protein Btru_069724 [Bulinus truncatus]|nr:hypothetical protein Btru_069724 [Bulinus truncatus]